MPISRSLQVKARHELYRRTLRMAAFLAERRDTRPSAQSPPCPGGIFLVPANRWVAVEWAVLEVDPTTWKALVVAVDTYPAVGTCDFAFAGPGWPPRTLRCGAWAWVAAAVLDAGHRVDVLPPEALEGARHRWAALVCGALNPSTRRSADNDPEYCSWLEELEVQLQGSLGAEVCAVA